MTPENPNALRSLFRQLGMLHCVEDVEFDEPNAKEKVMNNIERHFMECPQGAQDKLYCDRAKAAVGLYPWKGQPSALENAIDAIKQVRALLEEEQVLEPVEVVDIEEDEDGNAVAIEIERS